MSDHVHMMISIPPKVRSLTGGGRADRVPGYFSSTQDGKGDANDNYGSCVGIPAYRFD